MTNQTRRATLTTLCSAAVVGCAGRTGSGSQDEATLPEQCPTSQDLDVDWPRDIYTRSLIGFLTRYDAVSEFITAYEEAYLEKTKAEKRVESASFSVQSEHTPRKVADGFHVTVSYTGGIHSPAHFFMSAIELAPDGTPKGDRKIPGNGTLPDDREYISIDEIEDRGLRHLAKSAADSGHAEYTSSEISRYEELMGSLPSNVSLTVGESIGAFVDVNGTPVLVTMAEQPGRDGGFLHPVTNQYYVADNVIRRTTEKNKSPLDGKVVECRPTN